MPSKIELMTESAQQGLYDGFDGYRTASPDDHRDVLQHGVVVPDANVLLNLYRYTEEARDALLSVLERIGDQLWVPQQVLAEFWRNREGVLRDPRDTEVTAKEISDARTQALARFRAWANRVSLPSERSGELVRALGDGFDAVIAGIHEFSDSSAADAARDTARDRVLQRLEPLLAGRVGPPMEEAAYKDAVAEGLRRVMEREPPGYLDKSKDDDGAAGDYLVWEQVLIESARRGCDVLFVTGDVKDDWWRRAYGEQRGPRLELVDEMRRRSGRRLFMLRPAVLLSVAREALSVNVSNESVANTDTVDRLVSEGALLDGGWTADALRTLIEQLAWDAPVQRAVLLHAALDGGFIERDKVYELGDYPEERSLRGFTRPINRLAQTYRDAGLIDESAVDLLEARYLGLTDNPSLADGFAVSSGVIPLLVAVIERGGGS